MELKPGSAGHWRGGAAKGSHTHPVLIHVPIVLPASYCWRTRPKICLVSPGGMGAAQQETSQLQMVRA